MIYAMMYVLVLFVLLTCLHDWSFPDSQLTARSGRGLFIYARPLNSSRNLAVISYSGYCHLTPPGMSMCPVSNPLSMAQFFVISLRVVDSPLRLVWHPAMLFTVSIKTKPLYYWWCLPKQLSINPSPTVQWFMHNNEQLVHRKRTAIDKPYPGWTDPFSVTFVDLCQGSTKRHRLPTNGIELSEKCSATKRQLFVSFSVIEVPESHF